MYASIPLVSSGVVALRIPYCDRIFLFVVFMCIFSRFWRFDGWGQGRDVAMKEDYWGRLGMRGGEERYPQIVVRMLEENVFKSTNRI